MCIIWTLINLRIARSDSIRIPDNGGDEIVALRVHTSVGPLMNANIHTDFDINISSRGNTNATTASRVVPHTSAGASGHIVQAEIDGKDTVAPSDGAWIAVPEVLRTSINLSLLQAAPLLASCAMLLASGRAVRAVRMARRTGLGCRTGSAEEALAKLRQRAASRLITSAVSWGMLDRPGGRLREPSKLLGRAGGDASDCVFGM